jgi:hypothetical protein
MDAPPESVFDHSVVIAFGFVTEQTQFEPRLADGRAVTVAAVATRFGQDGNDVCGETISDFLPRVFDDDCALRFFARDAATIVALPSPMGWAMPSFETATLGLPLENFASRVTARCRRYIYR